MTKLAAIYVRTSTERQAERVSPVAQEQDSREHCARQGYQVVEVYRDIEKYRVGKKLVEPSGTRADRPQLKRMLADARAGKFEVIIAWREDRLYRSYRPMLDVLDCLDETGLDVELVKETFDKKLAPVKAWAARMELDAKHDRFIMGVGGCLEQGNTVFFTPPYGYGKDDAGNFIMNDIEAYWVLKIWTWYAEGEVMSEIRRRLVTGGAPQRRDSHNKRTWTTPWLYHMLRYAPYHTGLFPIRWGGETYEVPLPAIVPQDIASQVMKRRETYRKYPAGNLKAQALAPGLVYCFADVSRLQVVHHQATSKYGKVYHYTHYKCRAGGRNGEYHPDCCRQSPIERLDAQIWDKVWSFISVPGQFEEAIEQRISMLQAQEIDAEKECGRLSRELDEITIERQRVITWARKETITEADMETQLLALSFQENALKRGLAEAPLLLGGQADKLTRLAEAYRLQVKAGIEAINTLPDSPEAAAKQFAFRREIIEALVTRVDVMADKSVRVHLEIDFNISEAPMCWRLTDIPNYSLAVTL
jgi:site-specific DNA recombinase